MISHNVNESNQINMWSLASYRFGGDSDVAKDTLMFNMVMCWRLKLWTFS